jgi:hypothetical protein
MFHRLNSYGEFFTMKSIIAYPPTEVWATINYRTPIALFFGHKSRPPPPSLHHRYLLEDCWEGLNNKSIGSGDGGQGEGEE